MITITCISSTWELPVRGVPELKAVRGHVYVSIKLRMMDINVSSPISGEGSLNCAFVQHLA